MPFNATKYKQVRAALKKQECVIYGPRVLIMRDDAKTETAGGLVIPDSAQRREPMGTVVMLGQGFTEESEKLYVSGVGVGDRVTMNQYDGKEFKISTAGGIVLCDVAHIGNLYMGWKNKELSNGENIS